MNESIIHLAFHQILVQHTNKYFNHNRVLTRNQVMALFGCRVKFKKSIYFRNKLLDEMIGLGLLERVNGNSVKVVNLDVSQKLEGILT